VPAPPRLPTGLQLTRAARIVGRAFDEALAEAGGSLPVWLVLLSLKTRQVANQRELAAAVGVTEATLTHHLNAMESEGLLTRQRDETNRRIHVVELTEAGTATFLRLRDAAIAFDRRLRRGVSAEQLAGLERLLERVAANVGAADDGPAPWSGLIGSGQYVGVGGISRPSRAASTTARASAKRYSSP
jgi:MarR family transcriptional regulator, transcriptional regulator for hemolysin